ncbi:MAG: SRPBCC family protein [Nocardioidaceae bacterium]|nr:SRPBCC family protein [Nocardioidaceae bacterium]
MPDDDRVASRVVSVERTIPADAERIFNILADPAQHPLIDGSGSVRSASTNNPGRLAQGTRFGMRMSLGARYRIHNVVVEFEESRRIAWRHFAGHRWRYVLTPVDGGTLVREEWDSTSVPWAYPLLRLLGFPQRNRQGMQQTLVRLERRATDPSDAR